MSAAAYLPDRIDHESLREAAQGCRGCDLWKDATQAVIGEGPESAVIALGYAGWDAGQLEEEMARNAWLTVDADERVLFETPVEQRWHAAARLLGVDLRSLSSDAGHA